ncbi:hypothetical protein ACTA71_000896 [Dictyostelium dimigraforme]
MIHYIKVIIVLLFLIILNGIVVKSNILGDDIMNYNASADVIWNFDEIDKLLLGGSHNDTSKKSFGKVVCIYHNLKNQTELSIEFKLNNKLIYIYQTNLLKSDNGDSNGVYVTMDDSDQKILLAIFNELKSPKPTPSNQIKVNTNIKDSYFSAHFVGDANNELFKKIDKVLSWNPPLASKVKEYDSLQKLFIKYSKKFVV